MLFGQGYSEKEQKTLFMYFIMGIVLLELAVTVGAVIYSIANAKPVDGGVVRFSFPWIGYLVTIVLVPVLVLLIVHLVSLAFARPAEGAIDAELPPRLQSFFTLVRGAPTIILFAGFVALGAAIYYLDGLMAFLVKLGDSFHLIAIWVVASFSVAWIISYIVRAYLMYKTKQMEAEYNFRQEVLKQTGKVILNTKYALDTEIRLLPPALPASALQIPEQWTEIAIASATPLDSAATFDKQPDLAIAFDNQPDSKIASATPLDSAATFDKQPDSAATFDNQPDSAIASATQPTHNILSQTNPAEALQQNDPDPVAHTPADPPANSNNRSQPNAPL